MVSIPNNNERGKLSDIQISLLRLFDRGLSEEETLELRKILLNHFDQGLKAELEEVLSRKQYTEEDYHKMLLDDNYMIN